MDATHITGRLWMCGNASGAVLCWACRGDAGTEIYNVNLEWDDLASFARSTLSRSTIWRSSDRSLTVNVQRDRLLFLFTSPSQEGDKRAIPIMGETRILFEKALARLFFSQLLSRMKVRFEPIDCPRSRS